MLNCPNRVLVAPLFMLTLALAGCGGDGARTFGGGGTGGGLSGTGGDSSPDAGGTGGISGTGGAIGGTGGAIGSGGVSGSGGTTGSGGATGTGGRGTGGSGGRGGMVGTGGRVGSGGVVGTGGTGGGGIGTGGTGGANATTCNALATQYQNEMPNAKTCSLATVVPQCQTGVAASLGCGSSCTTYVQNATNLRQIATNWQAAGCAALVQVCPAILCINSQPGNCFVATGATAAMCQNGPPIATP